MPRVVEAVLGGIAVIVGMMSWLGCRSYSEWVVGQVHENNCTSYCIMDCCPSYGHTHSCLVSVIIGWQGGARQVYEVAHRLRSVNTFGW